MASRVVAARTVRLSLTDGDWVEVKAQLNHGEYQRMYESLYAIAPDGELRRQPLRMATALIIAYMVDWSLVGLNGDTIPIRDLTADEIEQRLNVLDQDTFVEIKTAVEAHVNANERARAEKKRTPTGAGMSLTT